MSVESVIVLGWMSNGLYIPCFLMSRGGPCHLEESVDSVDGKH